MIKGDLIRNATAFYQSLIPPHAPRFHKGDKLPHYNPQWKLVEMLGWGEFCEVWRVQHAISKKRLISNELRVESISNSSTLKKSRLEAKILSENQLPNFKLPFKVSEILGFVMFYPTKTFL